VLYALGDSVNFKTYDAPITLRRNTALWLSGMTVRGNTVPPQRIDYVIERDQGLCVEGMVPVTSNQGETCIDLYEWPNRSGELPQGEVNQAAAADSCASVGKRLCGAEEWRSACEGPEQGTYPYGNTYDERHCPAQQRSASRSGRSPVCRSYFGAFDMTGNVWEWTSTVAPGREDFFQVVGGSWDAAEKGKCSLSKYSFYPQNRYPFVGFRCCADRGVGN
jgi:formylglycine-generating enzyme required for sulfatase activity